MILKQRIIALGFWTLLVTLGMTVSLSAQEKVQVGFDGYYRPGEWCPVTVDLQTDENPFKGYISINVNRLNYIKQLDLPARTRKQITLNILITTPLSQLTIDIINTELTGPSPILSKTIPIKPLEAKEFLIGVEQNLYDFFYREFSRYTGAAQHARFFTFTPEQLPHRYQALESVDLLVISKDTIYDRDIKATLDLWHAGRNGNLLVLFGKQFDVPQIARFKPRLRDDALVTPEIYQVFERPRWLAQTKERLSTFLILYTLLGLAALLVILWLKKKRRVVILGIVGLNVIALPVILLLGLRLPGSYAERLTLVTVNNKDNLLTESAWFSINPLREMTMALSVGGNEFVRPLYPEAEALDQFAPVNFLTGETGQTNLEITGRNHHSRLIFNEETVRPAEATIRVETKIDGVIRRYRLTNELNYPLEDGVIVTPKGCYYFGCLAAGEIREIAVTESELTDWSRFFPAYLSDETKPHRYQRRFLEMWHQQNMPEKETVLGWVRSPVSGHSPTLDYPALWVIPGE